MDCVFLTSLMSLSLSGPSDRRSQHVQRHPEELGGLQTARRPGLSAAPTAGAVVLQPASCSLHAGRLVASLLLHSKWLRWTDKHTFV